MMTCIIASCPVVDLARCDAYLAYDYLLRTGMLSS